ncbi:MAG: hypothetical protein ACOY0T_18360 [Myxococcota bacterium]
MLSLQRFLPPLLGFIALLTGCGQPEPVSMDGPEKLAFTAERLTIALGNAELRLPNAAPPGTSVTVTGTGFAPGAEVQLTLDSDPVANAVAAADGTVSLEFQISADMPPGIYTLSANSAGSSGSARFAVRTDFAQDGFAPNYARYNPYENVVGPDNVLSLQRRWRSTNLSPLRGRIIVAGARLFATGIPELSIGDYERWLYAVGKGSRDWLWYAKLGAANGVFQRKTAVAAAYGFVYVGAADGLRVYPQDCRADFGECLPAWTGPTASHASTPVVYRNTVYLNSGGTLYAFPSSCPTTSCGPLWTAPSGADYSLAVAIYKNTVYTVGTPQVGSSSVLAAYPVDCRNDGNVCDPLWQSPIEGEPYDTPVLSNDRIFLVTGTALRAYRYDCGLDGATCTPLWRATGERFTAAPAVAEGVVYAQGTQPALFRNETYYSSAWAVNCRSNGGECRPLMRFATIFHDVTADLGPAFANGVVYTNSGAIPVSQCARDSSICPAPLWAADIIPDGYGGPGSISDGVLYIPGLDNKIYAYGLPAN